MKTFLLIFSLVFLVGCVTPSKEVKYSFFAAGHSYGKPGLDAKPELHPPFKKKFEFLNAQDKMDFGVLLGDVVWDPQNWVPVLEELKELKMPIHVARGNHDGRLKPFEQMFGPSYKKFENKGDLFIVLDPNLDKWNISGDQLVFLEKTLAEDGPKANNIFVFVHQLIWWDLKQVEFKRPRPNSVQNRDSMVNYWSEVEPLLKKTQKPVFMFGGDAGAFTKEQKDRKRRIEYGFQKRDNVSYITTGMGGGKRDNIVITEIFADHTVGFRLVHLNGRDIDGLGELDSEDWYN